MSIKRKLKNEETILNITNKVNDTVKDVFNNISATKNKIAKSYNSVKFDEFKFNIYSLVLNEIENKVVESIMKSACDFKISKRKSETYCSLEDVIQSVAYQNIDISLFLSDEYLDLLFNVIKIHFKSEDLIDIIEDNNILIFSFNN